MSSAGPVRALFPPELAVSVHSSRGDVAADELPAEEQALIEGARGRRPGEFAAGRRCARTALAGLGVRGVTVLRSGRAPIWPDGVVGSISHTNGYAVAAVRSQTDGAAMTTIGIDAEIAGRVGDNLHERLFTAQERAALSTLDLAARAERATVLFSAKEAFYKAQHPQTAAWVGFEDISIIAEGPELVLHRATDLSVLDRFAWPVLGRWTRDADVIVTAVWVSLNPAT